MNPEEFHRRLNVRTELLLKLLLIFKQIIRDINFLTEC
jgi:hypothetical protein